MLQSLFEPLRAIAVAARPTFSAVLVATVFPIVRVLHAEQIEMLLPVRPFFLQRCGAETGFHPMRDAILAHARLLHVVSVFVTSD